MSHKPRAVPSAAVSLQPNKDPLKDPPALRRLPSAEEDLAGGGYLITSMTLAPVRLTDLDERESPLNRHYFTLPSRRGPVNYREDSDNISDLLGLRER